MPAVSWPVIIYTDHHALTTVLSKSSVSRTGNYLDRMLFLFKPSYTPHFPHDSILQPKGKMEDKETLVIGNAVWFRLAEPY